MAGVFFKSADDYLSGADFKIEGTKTHSVDLNFSPGNLSQAVLNPVLKDVPEPRRASQADDDSADNDEHPRLHKSASELLSAVSDS